EAAAAYERLALEAGSPAAAVEAAHALSDLAFTRRDPALALRAYLFAKKGQIAGVDARAVLGRLEAAVRFHRPDDASAMGYEWVARRGRAKGGVEALAPRVRRALLDAPPDAILLTEGERAVAIGKTSRQVAIESACAPLATPFDALGAPDCHLRVDVDGSSHS